MGFNVIIILKNFCHFSADIKIGIYMATESKV